MPFRALEVTHDTFGQPFELESFDLACRQSLFVHKLAGLYPHLFSVFDYAGRSIIPSFVPHNTPDDNLLREWQPRKHGVPPYTVLTCSVTALMARILQDWLVTWSASLVAAMVQVDSIFPPKLVLRLLDCAESTFPRGQCITLQDHRPNNHGREGPSLVPSFLAYWGISLAFTSRTRTPRDS